MTITELQLAGEISNCPKRKGALSDLKSPCNKVVCNQLEVEPNFENFHRPEPWIGRLSSARVLFISSNPGLSIDQGPEREIFPIENWSIEDSAEFFVERFNQTHDPVYATYNHPTEPDFLTRSFDGEYRSGGKSSKTPQKTWSGIHKLATELLDENCSPDADYAVTEIVHCKSLMGAGVTEASGTCATQWMPKILATSPAKVLVLLGAKVRDNFAIPFLNAPTDFAITNGSSYSSMSQKERARRDIFMTHYEGKTRLVLFNWHPTSMETRGLTNAYGKKVVAWVKDVIDGRAELPANNADLTKELSALNLTEL
jgi:hypothetical protein